MDQLIDLTDGGVSLVWIGLDLDDDIVSYSIALGTSEETLNEVAPGVESTNHRVNLLANTFYVWQVLTRDESNNISTSPYFRFQTAP